MINPLLIVQTEQVALWPWSKPESRLRQIAPET